MSLNLPQSQGFQITAALVAAIKAEALLSTLPLARNPRRPADLDMGDNVLIVAEKSDSLLTSPGAVETRRRSVTVGALSRTTEGDADAEADALYLLLRTTTYAALKQLQAQGARVVGKITERDVQFHVDDLDVDGALVVGGWEIEYRFNRRPDL